MTQKQLLYFRKLLKQGLVLRFGLRPIKLEGRDVLVVEGQLITGY